MTELFFLLPAAFLAGLVDAVVGGGGLIQIPALFAGLPAAVPATIFGTNKVASISGTFTATLRYLRQVKVPWRVALLAASTAFVFSFLGAMSVALLPKEWARPLVLVLLVIVAIYTFLRKDFGAQDKGLTHGRCYLAGALLLGAGIGFYDGFFGPGTGSFLLFLFVRFFGLDFLRATSAAKVVNLSTNAAALFYFVPTGHVLWGLALSMAVCNIAGAQVGTVLALRHGSTFVRKLFLVIVLVLIVKFAYDTFM
ncbi:MAG TPA: TSUP family transporter [Rhodocyclaceae bacterium]|nr:TSUP family transporter [Rhodocyclaceae bacterium]